ncbi:hypothetical protein [Halomonas smyrnensis]|uniref:hypothetical protein n=1 Tax=Halomonas smyrnensis TaxID=720605 RepID=UPI000313D395|nr:hypothetical protein [Halomonas smyrnensis]
MSTFADKTAHQLIRNRVHDLTDLAAQIGENTSLCASAEQCGMSHLVMVTVYEPAGFAPPADGVQWTTLATLRAAMPKSGSSPQATAGALEDLEKIAAALRELLKGVTPCA